MPVLSCFPGQSTQTCACVQVNGVKEVSDYVTKLRRVGKGLGVFQFDQEIAARAPSMAAEATAIIAPNAAP